MKDIQTEYVDTQTAEVITSTPRSTLETLRIRGGGPVYVKRGRRVLYALTDLRVWLDEAKRRSSAER